MQQPSPPSSSAPSTDLECIQGQLTLVQLINEIELITGSTIECLVTGRRGLLIYRRHGQQLVDPNLIVDAAIAQREADSIASAQARTVANLAIGRRRVRPKRAERVNNAIYFYAVCEDDQSYSVSWRP
uniref:Roadblock/LAMTOR2 domain-containing protein n=1 Tax=Acrobeloides nanus TaxID=290746 RepID=A0A914CEU4_9BILA